MKNWIYTFIEEKGFDLNHIFECEGPDWGYNAIPLEVVVKHILIAPKDEQKEIKNTLVKIDFMNGDAMHFFKFLADRLAR